jgi:hypothetical protein
VAKIVLKMMTEELSYNTITDCGTRYGWRIHLGIKGGGYCRGKTPLIAPSHHHQLELHLGIKLWTKGVIFFKFNDIKN